MSTRKRPIEDAYASLEDRRQYLCSICKQPKKGHTCPGRPPTVILDDDDDEPPPPPPPPPGPPVDNLRTILENHLNLALQALDNKEASDKEQHRLKDVQMVRIKGELQGALFRQDELQKEKAELEKEKAELEKEKAELLASNALLTRLDPSSQKATALGWELYDSLIRKITQAYDQQLMQIKAAPDDQIIKSWGLHNDANTRIELEPVGQRAVASALEYWANPTNSKQDVLTKWYSISLSTHEVHDYDLLLKPTRNGLVGALTAGVDLSTSFGMELVQKNHKTGTERQLTLKDVSHQKIDDKIQFNEITISLRTNNGDFLFQPELDFIQNLNISNTLRRSTSDSLNDIASKIITSFTDLKYHGKAEAWLRLSHLFQFLEVAEFAFHNKQNPSCFIWMHGTITAPQIANDIFGINNKAFEKHNGVKGPGLYVAQSPYVPITWAGKTGLSGDIIFGIAVTYQGDPYFLRYRMDPLCQITSEPPDWRDKNIPHAIYMKHGQLNGAIPLGSVPKPK